MAEIKLAIAQYDIAWKDKHANFEKIQALLEGEDLDLLVLPEMFQTGFVVDDASLAETMDGETIQFMHTLSKEKDACVCGSLIVKEDEKLYNRFIAVYNQQVLAKYDKVHLFKMSGEDKHFTAGSESINFDFRGFKIKPIICYDLRFPYLSYTGSQQDLLIIVANWPEKRIAHWDVLLKARAVENQCYIAASNRIGYDGNGFYHPGHSVIMEPSGIIEEQSNNAKLLVSTLNTEKIQELRAGLPFLQDGKV